MQHVRKIAGSWEAWQGGKANKWAEYRLFFRTILFSRKREWFRTSKRNRRGDFAFPPNPLKATKGLPPFGNPAKRTTGKRGHPMDVRPHHDEMTVGWLKVWLWGILKGVLPLKAFSLFPARLFSLGLQREKGCFVFLLRKRERFRKVKSGLNTRPYF